MHIFKQYCGVRQYFIVYRFASERKRQVVIEQTRFLSPVFLGSEFKLENSYSGVNFCGNSFLQMAEKIAKSRTRNNLVPHGIHVEDHVDYQHVQNFMDKTDHERPNESTPSISNWHSNTTLFRSLWYAGPFTGLDWGLAGETYSTGVPHGTVLGPLCFRLYVNDYHGFRGPFSNYLWWNSSQLKFGDDSLLYGAIHSATDVLTLQRDLDRLVSWAQTGQMQFKLSKCYILKVHRSLSAITHQDTRLGQTREAVDHQPYLGVTLFKSLNGKEHILHVKNKANGSLGFIKRNFH